MLLTSAVFELHLFVLASEFAFLSTKHIWFLLSILEKKKKMDLIDPPLKPLWASLVAQQVKNPSAMQETCVQSLGWKDPLEKGKATHSNIRAWRIS